MRKDTFQKHIISLLLISVVQCWSPPAEYAATVYPDRDYIFCCCLFVSLNTTRVPKIRKEKKNSA